MGIEINHAIVVTGTYMHEQYIEQAHARAVEIFETVKNDLFPAADVAEALGLDVDGPRLVSPILKGVVNDVRSFFVAPDGSKEGWGPSALGDDARDAFVAYLEGLRYEDDSSPLSWIEVRYGNGGVDGVGSETAITRKDQ